jgi:hypothetical protein
MLLLMPEISVAHDDPRRNDRAKEYVMSWITALGVVATVSTSAGGAVAGMAAQDLGDVFTNPSLNPAKSTEGIATVASLTTVGVAAAVNVGQSVQAASLLAQASFAAGAASQTASLQPGADAAKATYDAAQAKADRSDWKTPILDACLIIHLSLSTLNGFNTPDEGDKLDPAAHLLDDAVKDLTSAADTTGWTGEEAEPVYSEKNKAQIDRVTAMAYIDRRFKAALTTQAEQVQDVKDQFSYVTAGFAILKPIYGAMTAFGGVSQSNSLYLQGVTGAAGILAGTQAQGRHHPKATANGNVLQGLATEYQNLSSSL